MEWLDTAMRLAGVFGLPAIILFWLRDRRTIKTKNVKLEGQLPYEIRTSAATTLEGEVAALQRAFSLDREVRSDTIKQLQKELATERAASAEKDRRIRDLQAKVDELRGQVRDLTENVTTLQDSLASITEELAAIESGDREIKSK